MSNIQKQHKISPAIAWLTIQKFIIFYCPLDGEHTSLFKSHEGVYFTIFIFNYNDSAQKTPAVRKNVRGMNAPITNNATIIPTGFSSGIVGFSWPDVLQNAVIRCIALLFQEKHFR